MSSSSNIFENSLFGVGFSTHSDIRTDGPSDESDELEENVDAWDKLKRRKKTESIDILYCFYFSYDD